MKVWLDHFVVSIRDLNRGIDDFEELTGVRAAFGGEHPTLGTHNALVSLGGDQYLELIAPRPGAELHPLFSEVGAQDTLTPILWAVATDDVDELHRTLGAEGYHFSEPTAGSRVTEDGELVRWSMILPGDAAPPDAPFCIEWHPETRHPSKTNPTGCSLQSFAVPSGESNDLQRMLDVMGLPAIADPEIEEISISLATPNGVITLGRISPVSGA